MDVDHFFFNASHCSTGSCDCLVERGDVYSDSPPLTAFSLCFLRGLRRRHRPGLRLGSIARSLPSEESRWRARDGDFAGLCMCCVSVTVRPGAPPGLHSGWTDGRTDGRMDEHAVRATTQPLLRVSPPAGWVGGWVILPTPLGSLGRQL